MYIKFYEIEGVGQLINIYYIYLDIYYIYLDIYDMIFEVVNYY